MNITWAELGTAGRIALVNWLGEQLRGDGKVAVLSARQLAAEAGCRISGPAPTRNAIVGLVSRHRDKITTVQLHKPAGGWAERKPRKKVSISPVQKHVKPSMRIYSLTPNRMPPATKSGAVNSSRRLDLAFSGNASDKIPEPLNLTLVELTERTCRWPVNDPPRHGTHLFCGCKSMANSPYCEGHYQMSIGRGTESERRAHQIGKAA